MADCSRCGKKIGFLIGLLYEKEQLCFACIREDEKASKIPTKPFCTESMKRSMQINSRDAVINELKATQGIMPNLEMPLGFIQEDAGNTHEVVLFSVVEADPIQDKTGSNVDTCPLESRTTLSPKLQRSTVCKRWILVILLGFAAILLSIYFLNMNLDNIVQKVLNADYRNIYFSLSARYSGYVNVGTLVLDLRKADNSAPVDLFRGLFQTAEALYQSNKRFSIVFLSTHGRTIFSMDGSDFYILGREYTNQENPLYLMRTLPEKLKTPSGYKAYERIFPEGFLVQVGKELKDAVDVAQKWRRGW